MDIQTKPRRGALSGTTCPGSASELVELITAVGGSRVSSFHTLEGAVASSPGFLQETLPFVYEVARRAEELLPEEIPILDGPGALSLSRLQCLCLLANAFFCSFTERVSQSCLSGPGLPSFNLDELYNGFGSSSVKEAKLHMFFCYFERSRRRSEAGDPLEGAVRLRRRRARRSSPSDWEACQAPLVLPVVHAVGEPLDASEAAIKVDFANKIVGGASLAYGCVQEEILFSLRPELNVSRLVCPQMEDDEAILIDGAEQHSRSVGYGQSLRYAGPVEEGEERPGDTHCAIDALDLRDGEVRRQYRPELVLRELTKAWAGFSVEDIEGPVATGNWGCGVFGGDVALKSVIQWLATSRADRAMHYFPFDNRLVSRKLPELAEALVERGVTVGDVAGYLLRDLKPGGVYQQLGERFGVGR